MRLQFEIHQVQIRASDFRDGAAGEAEEKPLLYLSFSTPSNNCLKADLNKHMSRKHSMATRRVRDTSVSIVRMSPLLTERT